MSAQAEETTRERLVAERMRKLEATLNAYDACLHTDRVDRMRKRIDMLETVLSDIAASGAVSAQTAQEIYVLLSKKFP